MAQERLSAEKALVGAVEAMKKDDTSPGTNRDSKAGEGDASSAEPAPSQRGDAELLLSDVLIEGKEYRRTIDLLDPLIARFRAEKPRSLEASTLRGFFAAIRAHVALNEMEKSAEIALLLIEHSQDTGKVNAALVGFAQLLRQELARVDADVNKAQVGNAANLGELVAKRDLLQALLTKVLDPLSDRKDHTVADMLYLADACAAMGLTERVRELYHRVLEKGKEDAEFARANETALVRASLQLVRLLRTQGRFEEAVKEADVLIAKYPRLLEPKMAKANILDDWAKKDYTKCDVAIAHGTEIRVWLGRLKPKPPEYYDVVYKVACLLYYQFEATKDRSKLQHAEQLLKSTLVLNSKLTGPELVAQYQELLTRIATAQGKNAKDAKNEPIPAVGKPAP
jgi:tetratricopeptide (TPR) repeat protein